MIWSQLFPRYFVDGIHKYYVNLPLYDQAAVVANVRDIDYTRLEIQGSTTNPFIWEGNVGNIKSALDYATIWRAFRDCFYFESIFLCILKYSNRENH